MLRIPEPEIKFTFSRSSGAGGQNVNKVETKVTAKWNFQKSRLLNEFQRMLIFMKLRNRINEKGELVVYCQTERSQKQNKEKATKILNNLVNSASKILPKRKPTRIPRFVKEKRLQNKKKKSEKKKSRRKIEF